MSTFADTTDEAWREELELKFFSQILPDPRVQAAARQERRAAILAVNSLLAYQPEASHGLHLGGAGGRPKPAEVAGARIRPEDPASIPCCSD